MLHPQCPEKVCTLYTANYNTQTCMHVCMHAWRKRKESGNKLATMSLVVIKFLALDFAAFRCSCKRRLLLYAGG